jgi:mRNA-degrading endonuclease toxin of MazEF toxin-antitoxin module
MTNSASRASSYRRGDVALLEVEFADRPGRKLRPVVVVSGERYNSVGPDLLVSTITSNPRPLPHVGDHRIQHWKRAGLKHPSVAQAKLATTDAARMRRKLGELHPEDLKSLEAGLKEALDLA